MLHRYLSQKNLIYVDNKAKMVQGCCVKKKRFMELREIECERERFRELE